MGVAVVVDWRGSVVVSLGGALWSLCIADLLPWPRISLLYIATQLRLTYLGDMPSDSPFASTLVASMSSVTLRCQLRRREWEHV